MRSLRLIFVLLLVALHAVQGFAAVRMTASQPMQSASHLTPCHDEGAMDMKMATTTQSGTAAEAAVDATNLPDCCQAQANCAMCIHVALQIPFGTKTNLHSARTPERFVAQGNTYFASAVVAALTKPPIS